MTRDNDVEANSEIKSAELVAEEIMGPIGTWQLPLVIIMFLIRFPMAWSTASYIFTNAPVAYHCLDSNNSCVAADGQPCTSWVYDRSVFTSTIITEWNLVCSKDQLANVVQSAYIVGVMIGNVVFSAASDRWGRHWPLVLATLTQAASGMASAFAPNYLSFLFLRFMQGIGISGSKTLSKILCYEVLSGRPRSVTMMLTRIPQDLGTALLAAIAYALRDWRHLQMAITLPSVIAFFIWYFPESPKWLISVDRHKEAMEVLRKAARTNRRPLPEALPPNRVEEVKREGVMGLLCLPGARRCLLIVWTNAAVASLSLYGLQQYLSVVGNNIFLSVGVSGVFPLFGIAVASYAVSRIGRIKCMVAIYLLGAISCCLTAIIPGDTVGVGWWRVGLATPGLCAGYVTTTIVYLYASELSPTCCRSRAVASAGIVGKVGAVIAPYIVSMYNISVVIPPAIICGANLCAALLCCLLPETNGRVLPTTIQEVEEFIREKDKDKTENKEEGIVQIKKGEDNRAYKPDDSEAVPRDQSNIRQENGI